LASIIKPADNVMFERDGRLNVMFESPQWQQIAILTKRNSVAISIGHIAQKCQDNH